MSTATVLLVPSDRAPRIKSSLRITYYPEALVCIQFACQSLLLSSAIGAGRIVVRSLSLGVSIFLLVLTERSPRRFHPSAKTAWWILLVVGLAFFHPGTASILAGLMQICVYLSIVAPLFWVPRLNASRKTFERVLLLIWLFSAASAAVGILQVQYPGKFQPAVSTAIQSAGENYVNSLYIRTAQGVRVFRPMGLTDVPGGACVAGYTAALLGIGFLLVSKRHLSKLLCLATICIGLTCLYLSQVRSLLIGLAVGVCFVSAMLAWSGQTKRAAAVISTLVVLFIAGLMWAITLAPESVEERISTLKDRSVVDVYNRNRGSFLWDTLTELLPKYPFGVGLGRWGPSNTYFGNLTDPLKEPIHAEIQWTGWILDGGISLALIYLFAIGQAVVYSWSVSKNKRYGDLAIWSAIVFALNVSTLALTLDSPVFNSSLGAQFWLLNALLVAAVATQCRAKAHPE